MTHPIADIMNRFPEPHERADLSTAGYFAWRAAFELTLLAILRGNHENARLYARDTVRFGRKQ